MKNKICNSCNSYFVNYTEHVRASAATYATYLLQQFDSVDCCAQFHFL